MSVNDIRIEKLCEGQHWVDSHVRFTKIGDIIKVKSIPEKQYKVLTEPIWAPAELMWTVDMELYEGK